MHLNSRAGSYIESSIPVIQEQDGITTKTSGQLMNVETTTSMQFHSLFESETLEACWSVIYFFQQQCHYKIRHKFCAVKIINIGVILKTVGKMISSFYFIFD